MHRILRGLGLLVLVLIVIGSVVYFIFAARSQKMAAHPFFRPDDPPVLVIAHQGGEGERPSNTMSAFQHAVEVGADVLEMDIHSTKDNVLVVIHDETVDRTTNGTGRVQDLTFEEIQQLDAGYSFPNLEEARERTDRPFRGQGVTIPALEEVFKTFPQMRMVIEIKQKSPSIAGQLCDMLREYKLEQQVIVASFHPVAMYEFRAACPEVATSAVEEEIRPFFLLNLVGLGRAWQPVAHSFQVPEYGGGFHIMTEGFVEGARYHNVTVQPWTINSEEDMRRMIDLKVNGIITDYPSRLLELLGRAK